MTPRRPLVAVAVLAALGVVALVIRALSPPPGTYLALQSRPIGVMGTQTALTAVVRPDQKPLAIDALAQAEVALRRVEARMSTYLERSELSRLNAASPGDAVKLSPETLAVLRLSRQVHRQTDGAFDVTFLPVFQLWGRAGKAKRLPTDEDLAAARALCGWDKWELLEDGARKRIAGAGIGLGGIAKGHSIDLAAEAMRRSGALGGLVDVGGDIRCFGPSPRGGAWRVAVRDPFVPAGQSYFGTLELQDAAVCTSGNYERFAEIGGKRYSHIIDPRTAQPMDLAPSVTVVAPTAVVADGWATALSVLGRDGLRRIDPNSGIEAMIVVGGPRDYHIHQTPGFARLLASPVDVR